MLRYGQNILTYQNVIKIVPSVTPMHRPQNRFIHVFNKHFIDMVDKEVVAKLKNGSQPPKLANNTNTVADQTLLTLQ